MPLLSTYNPSANFAIAFQGGPGTGKTTLALQFPSPGIVDCDNNLGGAVRWLQQNNPSQLEKITYETVNVDEKGKEVPPRERYERFKAITQRMVNDPKVKTIIHDSGTYISDYIMDDIRRQNARKETEFQLPDWNGYLWAWKNLITQMRSCGKTYILTLHEKTEKDDVEGIIKFFIALPGQIQGTIGGLFTDVWRMEVEESQGKHINVIRTKPNVRMILKNSMPTMPAKFEAKWSEIAKYTGLGQEESAKDKPAVDVGITTIK